MSIFLASRDAPSRCTATDCLVRYVSEISDFLVVNMRVALSGEIAFETWLV